jgi:cytochrome c oxidase subunit II
MDPRHIFGRAFGIEVRIAVVVFALICLAVFAALLLSARRRRRDIEPSQQEEAPRLESLYVLAVAAVAGFVMFLSLHSNHQERAGASTGGTRVQITGFQWCWRFVYPGSSVRVTGTCSQGQLPTMVVPVGQPVTIEVTSTDVIHSWWVPELRYKLDGFPNHTNTMTFTVDHTGQWVGRCAEFCGHGHYTMDFLLRAVSRQQYQKWLASGGAPGALAA